MTESEFLTRIDRHLERIDVHIERGDAAMERGNELMERGNELMVDVREEMALNREERSESRLFMRELTLRAEKVAQRQMAQLAANTKAIADLSISNTRKLDDLHLESRQQTQALMRMLDRFDNPGPA